MIRIAFLDTHDERCVPHVISDAFTVHSYVTTGEAKDKPYAYQASMVIRRATVEDMEAWNAGEGEG